jgi:uncharacterized protein (DUF302 family)
MKPRLLVTQLRKPMQLRMASRLVLLTLLAGLVMSTAQADNLLMARSPHAFPEAMSALQNSIHAHGYVVTHVQRVDVGLKSSGFATDKYRIVFFAKPDELRSLIDRYPLLAPYLPLKITLFAEQDETLLTTFDPRMLKDLLPGAHGAAQLQQWLRDVQGILADLRSDE